MLNATNSVVQRNYFLAGIEKKLMHKMKHFFLYFRSEYLTLATIFWTILAICFSLLAALDNIWLLGIGIVIFLQYLTDYFDGLIGREKKTGLVYWGYYMDHSLDYIFLCSILLGYLMIIDSQYSLLIFFMLFLLSSFAIYAFLMRELTGIFNVSYFGIGPTEIRLVGIILAFYFGIFGVTQMALLFEIVIIILSVGLLYILFETFQQKKYNPLFTSQATKFCWYLFISLIFISLSFYHKNNQFFLITCLLFLEFSLISYLLIQKILIIPVSMHQYHLKNNISNLFLLQKHFILPAFFLIGFLVLEMYSLSFILFFIFLLFLSITIFKVQQNRWELDMAIRNSNNK